MAANYRDFWSLAFKRNQFFVFFSLIFFIFLSWTYIIHLNSAMPDSMNSMVDGLSMPQFNQWTLNDLVSALLMWSVMMVAMMLPSAAPMILVFSAVNKKRLGDGREFVPTYIFVIGYILIWIAFSLFAASLQWLLHSLLILSPELKIISPMASSTILILAGVYQFTPIKNKCLKNCQNTFGFVTEYWREGKKGAFIMGLRHGLYCLGCCWVLMSLLFVAGVMNLLWVALIAVFILIEKIVKVGNWLSSTLGTLLITWGFWMFFLV